MKKIGDFKAFNRREYIRQRSRTGIIGMVFFLGDVTKYNSSPTRRISNKLLLQVQ